MTPATCSDSRRSCVSGESRSTSPARKRLPTPAGSRTTYRKVEGTETAGPQRVNKSTYAKVDAGFGFEADACLAVADGLADSIRLKDGTELIEGGAIRDFVSLEDEIDRAFDRSAQLTNPDLTMSTAKAQKEEMFRLLRERGVIKSN